MVFLEAAAAAEEEEYDDLLHLIGCNPAKKKRSSPAKKPNNNGFDHQEFLRPPAAFPLHQPPQITMTRFDWLLLAAEIAQQELEKKKKSEITLESPPDASKEQSEKKKRKRKASASPPHASEKKRKTVNDASCCRRAAAVEERIRGVAAAAGVGVELPPEFRRRVMEMGGKEEEAVLVIQKKLFQSDVTPNNGRFSIPSNQVANDFLTPQEEHSLRSGTKIDDVLMIEPDCTSVGPITLTKWDMSANGIYNLISNWNSVRERNGLVKGDLVQLWAFRTHPSQKLCLAMVLLHSMN